MTNNHVDIKNKASKILGCSVDNNDSGVINNVAGELRKEKNMFAGLSADEKTLIAMDQLKNKITREDIAVNKYHEALHMREALGEVSSYKEEKSSGHFDRFLEPNSDQSLDVDMEASANSIQSASELKSFKE